MKPADAKTAYGALPGLAPSGYPVFARPKVSRSPERLIALAVLMAGAALLVTAAYLLSVSDGAAADRFYPLLFGLGGLLTMILTGLLFAKVMPVSRRRREVGVIADTHVRATSEASEDAA